jgi:hypothetical protein
MPCDAAQRHAAAALVIVAGACGPKHPPPARAGDFADLDDVDIPGAAGAAAPTDATRATAPTLVAGHADARYAFVIPSGLSRLRGVTAQPGEDPRELSLAGPDGVGMPTVTAVSLDSIVVFSDPLGLGVDVGAITPAERDRLVTMYGEYLRQRFPSAKPARPTTIGPHAAIRVDLPRVELVDRPVRGGRHYLILDGGVTVSVDCVWTDEHAEHMAAACDAVAASLRRRSAAAR